MFVICTINTANLLSEKKNTAKDQHISSEQKEKGKNGTPPPVPSATSAVRSSRVHILAVIQ
jgi:hypothetical protein